MKYVLILMMVGVVGCATASDEYPMPEVEEPLGEPFVEEAGPTIVVNWEEDFHSKLDNSWDCELLLRDETPVIECEERIENVD